jgi:hypothetical protein
MLGNSLRQACADAALVCHRFFTSCAQDTGVGLPHVSSAGAGHMRGYVEGRHGPSKLRMSSSDHSSIPASAALAAAGMQVRPEL